MSTIDSSNLLSSCSSFAGPPGVIYRGSDANYKGREICLGCNENTVTIVDVTNKAAPVRLSKTSYKSVCYTHQGWLTDDHNHFIFGDEFDEGTGSNTKTLVLNLGSNLKKPVIGGAHFSSLKVTDHNQ